MKITLEYVSTKHYNGKNIIQWMWMFRKYAYVKGFTIRLFGININIRESNATQKMINQFKNK